MSSVNGFKIGDIVKKKVRGTKQYKIDKFDGSTWFGFRARLVPVDGKGKAFYESVINLVIEDEPVVGLIEVGDTVKYKGFSQEYIVFSRRKESVQIRHCGTDSLYSTNPDNLVIVKKHKKEKEMYILWSPTSTIPPRVQHDNLRDAEQARDVMIRKYPSQTFYVMKAVSKSTAEPVKQYDYKVENY